MEDTLLLPLERLEKCLRHPSPVVRIWAWERLETIYPERLSEFVPLALEEKDRLVLEEALRAFRDKASSISPEDREALQANLLERLQEEKSPDLLLVSLQLFGVLGVLTTVLSENPWLVERIFGDEKFAPLFFHRVLFQLPLSEIEAFQSLLDQPIPEWEAYLAGNRIWNTADPSPVKEVYAHLREHLPYILLGLQTTLTKEDYFLDILPEKERESFKNLENKRNRRRVRAFIEEEFEKLREEVVKRRGEINLRRHLERPRSLGVVFRTLETLLAISDGDLSEPVVESLGLLFLTLLWGKPLLGLPENLSREELLDLYFEETHPIFPEDEDLRKKILALLETDKDLKEVLRQRLRKVFSEDSYGAERGVNLVRECGKTFLPELLDFFEKSVKENFLDREYIEEALVPWIREKEVRRRLLEMAEKYGDHTIFFILEHYPTSEAALTLARDFETWIKRDFESLGWLSSFFPHPELWKKMKEALHPWVRDWKETFVIFAHLFEPEFPGLEELERETYHEMKEDTAILLEEKIPPSSPMVLTLACEVCGYYFPFKPRVVLVGGEEPDLPEKVVCPRCGAEERFSLPKREKAHLTAQMWRLLEEKQEFEEWRDGILPVEGLIINIKGQKRTFSRYREALEHYRHMVETHARDPEVLSGYIHLLLKGRRLEEAREALERLKVLDPACVDHAYLWAIYYRLRNEPERALEFYRKALEALARRAPFYRFHPQDPAETLRAIFFEARDYARTTGKPFSIDEDLLRERKKVGRNDPCPCGSGKKYKKCCMKKQEVAREKQSAQSPEEKRAFRLYEGFVIRKYKQELLAFLEEWIPRLEEISREQDPDRDWIPFISEMFLFLGRGRSGKPVVEEFLESKGRNLSEAEKAILASLRKAYPGLYEVLDVDEDKGYLLLRDRITETSFPVRDYSLAKQLAPGEKIWTMLFRAGDHWRPSRVALPVPVLSEPQVYQKVREMFEASGEKDYPSFARKKAPEIFLEVVKILFAPLEIRFITPEGDEVVLVRAHYELLSPEVEDLFPTGDFIRGEEHEYILVEPAEGSVWSAGKLSSRKEEFRPGTLVLQSRYLGKYLEIGRVEFLPEKGRVRLEALSRPRMERLRKAFEKVAGEGVRFLLEEISDFEKFMKGVPREGKEIPDEEAAELRWLEYLAWLDTPEPELEGRTPREAWQDPDLRPRVEEMLRRFEALEKHQKREGRKHLNIRKLRPLLENA
ncbi:tetratricopeptide repeat protein [Thermosulfurimonas dismutans]|uniref:Uncharacterized protein n=1 Tax=Thermosulfurimonas dismutans TaxID=999894 RepID=A0A179D209_9BACT|nr:tetratricopeptide repeat protein [Thermosulfurimonas dismutans]OAQ20023.1 hypothetical protein TDIS_1842 [Thermosulfurimonas dismutans]